MLSDKLILVDVDGVLVDWLYSFDRWMERHGHTKVRTDTYNLADAYGLEDQEGRHLVGVFNESAVIGYLPPLRDAIEYVQKLHRKHGYVFHAITSLSKDPFAIRARESNLNKLFGDTVFERLVCLDTGESKYDVLADYKDTGCVWIEDLPVNAMTGLNLGLNPILVNQEHNHGFNATAHNIPRVTYWREIYEVIT